MFGRARCDHRQRPAHPRPAEPRVGRIPRPLPPDRIAEGYAAAIRRHVIDLARAAFERRAPEILRALVDLRRHQGHADAAKPPRPQSAPSTDPTPHDAKRARVKAGEIDAELAHATEQGKRAARMIDAAAADFADAFDPEELRTVVAMFGKRTDMHSRLQLDRMLRSAIGIPLSALGPGVEAQLDEWAALNVSRIVTAPETMFDRLRLDVLDAVQQMPGGAA
jgi:hypothetical protein